MRRILPIFLILMSFSLVGTVAGSGPARAEDAALVIGNGAYRANLGISTAASDAELIASTLERMKFSVRQETNLNREKFLRTIRQFAERARSGKKPKRLFFYYTGHAIQIDGENYLVPVRAKITDEESVKAKGVGLSAIVRGLRKIGAEQNVFILDASRGYPLKNITKPMPPGLAAFVAPFNSIVAFSARPGKVLFQEEAGKTHSAYALALSAQMSVENVAIEDALKSVRSQIAELTHPDHAPWENSSLVGDSVLVPGSGGEDSKPDTRIVRDSLAADAWRALGNNPDLTEVEAFLKFFPGTSISTEARDKLAELREKQRKKQRAKAETAAKKANRPKQKSRPANRTLSYFPKQPQNPILRDRTATKHLAAFIKGFKKRKYRFSREAKGRDVATKLKFGRGFAGLFNEVRREVRLRERQGEKITRKKLLGLMRSIHAEQKSLERAARDAKGKFGLIVYAKSLQSGVSSYPLVWRRKPDFGVLYQQMEHAYPELQGVGDEARFVKEADAIFWQMKSYHKKNNRISISDVIKAIRRRALR
ncbi:MAG: hypothetical protein GY948_04950 [Alphaproteobacteria bacterium]|nr:hypothetical protein [Alphaproteobacteria bacterium]